MIKANTVAPRFKFLPFVSAADSKIRKCEAFSIYQVILNIL